MPMTENHIIAVAHHRNLWRCHPQIICHSHP
jgi:hypothetical protein